MAAAARQRHITAPGLLITAMATAFFAWAGLQWISQVAWPAPDRIEEATLNELKAFRCLQQIYVAQEIYKLRDWDGDGQKQYAQFFVHLWRSVDQQGRPVEVDLLHEGLALAMGPSRAVDGYYYVNLHSQQTLPSGPLQKMDCLKEWAVAAVPADSQTTGLLSMVIDQRGTVFAKAGAGALTHLPLDPVTDNWTQIGSVPDLKAYQDTLDYRVAIKP